MSLELGVAPWRLIRLGFTLVDSVLSMRANEPLVRGRSLHSRFVWQVANDSRPTVCGKK